MKKVIVSVFAVATMVVGLAANEGCTINPCPGQQVCGNGCIDPTAVCCPGGNTNCPSGTVCNANGTECLSNPVNTAEAACQGCLNAGGVCCPNFDGTVDCAPGPAVGGVSNPVSQCCGYHDHCSGATYCCTSGCCN